MDAGLKVRLNPDGGNQLNFREALRLYLAPIEEPEQQAEDDDYDENGENEPRKNVIDDYDYDDDFIDDGEVFEDEVAGTPPNERQDNDVVAGNQQQGSKLVEKAPTHHGFANFWVNKGNLPSKKDTVMPQPPSVLGNVVLEHVKVPALTKETANGSPPATSAQKPGEPGRGKEGVKKGGERSQKGGASVQTSGPSEGSKKCNPNQTNTVSGTNSSKPNSGRPSQTKSKTVQESVIEEIGKLAALCQKEFGDKKPKLSDPRVQEQLHVMFRAAMSANVGKLFSDIAKDRRVVALADGVWNRLGFLRVKRANLETLGHALIWSAKEKAAIASVEKTEGELERFMRERREKSGGAEGALMAVAFDNEVDSRIYEWYRAKCELQTAKNQLGSRVKSVKKCVGGWVVSLKKIGFQGWSVAEGEIVEAFRRVEDVRNAAEKQRREMEKQQREIERQRKENERLEKKRKREEQVAAAAAAAAAASAAAKRVAVEKSGGGGVVGGTGGGVGVMKAKTIKIGNGGINKNGKNVKIVKNVKKENLKKNSLMKGNAQKRGMKMKEGGEKSVKNIITDKEKMREKTKSDVTVKTEVDCGNVTNVKTSEKEKTVVIELD